MTPCILRVLLLGACFSSISSSRVLLLPFYSQSHCRPHAVVGEELRRKGHEVFAYLPEQFDSKKCFQDTSVTILNFKMNQTNWDDYMSMAGSDYSSHIFAKVKAVTKIICTGVFLNHDEDFVRLRTLGFDIAIADLFRPTECFAVIPAKLGIPYVNLSPFNTWWQTGKPFIPNIEPMPLLEVHGSMSFPQRILNTVLYFVAYYIDPVYLRQEVESKFLPHGLNVNELVSNAVLHIFDNSLLLSGPMPTQPNILLTGGFSSARPKPLPKQLSSFVSKYGGNGIVTISFGSMYRDSNAHVMEALEHTCAQLPQGFIWKSDTTTNNKNILKTKWMPQNDVLGHKQTKVFVSHCGRNSFYEGLYHGVPIICIPHEADQFYNAIAVERLGLGKTIRLEDVNNTTLKELMTAFLHNVSVIQNAKRASEIYRDLHPEPSEKMAAQRIEHVIKYGGKHLRPAAYGMSLLALTMLDIWAAFFGGLFVFFAIMSFCVRKIYSRLCRNVTTRQKTQ